MPRQCWGHGRDLLGAEGDGRGEEEEMTSLQQPSCFTVGLLEGFGLVIHPFPCW